MALRFDFERAGASLVAGVAVILTSGILLESAGYPKAMRTAATASGVFIVFAGLVSLIIAVTSWFEDYRRSNR